MRCEIVAGRPIGRGRGGEGNASDAREARKAMDKLGRGNMGENVEKIAEGRLRKRLHLRE